MVYIWEVRQLSKEAREYGDGSWDNQSQGMYIVVRKRKMKEFDYYILHPAISSVSCVGRQTGWRDSTSILLMWYYCG